MLKEVLFVGGSAALGGYLATKYGAPIEAQAIKLKIPAPVAHMIVVGGTAAGGYFLLRSIF